MEAGNIRKYYLRYVLYYCGYCLISGGIAQSFMLESGLTGTQVSVYTAVIQFVQAAAMLLLGPVLEKRRDIIRVNAEAGLGLLPLFMAMLILCFATGMSADLKYTLLIVSSVIAYIALGVIGILEYKLPYRIIRMENYGRVLSLAGMTIGVTSLVCSSLFTFFISRFDYFKVMAVFLTAGMAGMILSVFVGKSYRDLGAETQRDGKEEEPEQAAAGVSLRSFLSIFSYGPFRKLFIPNLFRGIASGTFALLTTVGYYFGLVNAGTAAVMTVVANIVVMGGCLLYAALSRRNIDRFLVLGGCAGLLVCMPAMLIGQNTVIFIVLYAVATLFRNFVDYGCPVICTQIVDYEHMGQFSAWRIALYMLGGSLAGLVTIPMLDRLGGFLTMLINGVIFLITGLGYFFASPAGNGSDGNADRHKTAEN